LGHASVVSITSARSLYSNCRVAEPRQDNIRSYAVEPKKSKIKG
jgi:hypothetical protein